MNGNGNEDNDLKGMHMVSNNTPLGCVLSVCIKGHGKHSQRHYTTTTGLNLWKTNSDPDICMSQQKSRFLGPGAVFPVFHSPVWMSLCPLESPFPVFSSQEENLVWSSATAAHPLQVSKMCCVQRCLSAYHCCNTWLFE